MKDRDTVSCHRLLRCHPEVLARCIVDRHPGSRLGAAANQARWFAHPGPSKVLTLSWRSRSPVGLLNCCLEIERGACSVIVHLTTEPAGRIGRRRASTVESLWAVRELAVLAHLAEARDACQRWPGDGDLDGIGLDRAG